jgi:hypothetical protein
VSVPFGELVLIGVVTWVLVLFVGRPLLGGETEMDAEAEPDLLLKDRKAALLLGIKELEMDLAMGKIGEDEYRALREDLEREAVETLKELERRVPSTTPETS